MFGRICTSALASFIVAANVYADNPCYPIIPDVVQCRGDVDDGSFTGTPDGGVTIDDFLYYLHMYTEGSPCADFDDGTGTGTSDGGVTIEDLLYFWRDWCC